MRKKEDGYIVVETTVAFMLFTLLVVSILSLINIVVVQTRVHYALTQTATELSMYSYVIDVLGLTSDIKALDRTGQEVQGKIDSVINDLNTIERGLTTPPSDTTKFFGNLDAVLGAIQGLANTGQEIIENPKGTFVNVVRFGLDKAKNNAMQVVMRPMLEKYLENDGQSADSFLRSYGVKDGISLDGSVFIDSNGDITIVASYDIDYTFGLLPLPKDVKTIHVKQTAKTKAWLGGAD